MISMLGVSILSEIAQFEIETDLILNKLRDRIIKELGQESADKTINDGMDLSLIRYDLKTKEVQISAAFNPVYIIRSKSHPCKEGSLEILAENEEYFIYATQANRQPIGHYFEMTPFDAVTVQLISGDMIFQFSDGYVDQFGGPKNKKFMRKRLLALLLTIHTKPAEQQRDELWQTMEAWMGKNEQVDDISAIGIKI
jgi:serine phosphatase RsbU (regulator of sigma subunit)